MRAERHPPWETTIGHLLGVNLDKPTTPWAVDIDSHGNANHVGRSPEPQTLVWALTGDAAGGDLLSLQWIEPPPEGVFGPPDCRQTPSA